MAWLNLSEEPYVGSISNAHKFKRSLDGSVDLYLQNESYG